MRRSLAGIAAICAGLLMVGPSPSGVNPLAIAQNASDGASSPDALATTYAQAMQAKDWPRAVSAAQQLVQARPSSENLFLLANAQLYAGAKEESVATYDRALAAANAEKPAEGQPSNAWKEQLAKIYTGKGNALLKLGSSAKAVEAYSEAAKLSSNPGKAYFNVCAVLYNTGATEQTAAACRKSLQADPGRADAWFILGSVLFVGAHTDANGKFILSAETRQALDKYLELAPEGPHAADVKAMLDAAAK